MPTPAKTSPQELIAIARTLVDAGGVDSLTLSAVASTAGVKAPSLYKHFADRAALLKAVEISVLTELEVVLRDATKGRTSAQRLRGMAYAYRKFGRDHPHRYGAIYSEHAFDDPDIAAACFVVAKPLFEELEAGGVAPDRILPLSRTITAWLHGFVTMEIVRAFRLGGSIDEAFEDGLDTVLAGI